MVVGGVQGPLHGPPTGEGTQAFSGPSSAAPTSTSPPPIANILPQSFMILCLENFIFMLLFFSFFPPLF